MVKREKKMVDVQTFETQGGGSLTRRALPTEPHLQVQVCLCTLCLFCNSKSSNFLIFTTLARAQTLLW